MPLPASDLSSPSSLRAADLAARPELRIGLPRAVGCPEPGIAKIATAARSACSAFNARPTRPGLSSGAAGDARLNDPLPHAQAGAERRVGSILRLKPKRAVVVDCHLITGGDRRQREQIERVLC
jgi:hypothetical protein